MAYFSSNLGASSIRPRFQIPPRRQLFAQNRMATASALNPPTASTVYGAAGRVAAPATSGFGISDPSRVFDRQGNFADQIKQHEGDAVAFLPYDLLNSYNQIAQQGIYGQGGIDQIIGRLTAAMKTRGVADTRALRRRVAGRVGPRSGAAETLIANKVLAPQLADLLSTKAGLQRENQTSKAQALGDILRIYQLLQQRYDNAQAQDGSGGFLGVLGDLAGTASDIASLIPGPQQPVAAAASGGRRVFQ